MSAYHLNFYQQPYIGSYHFFHMDDLENFLHQFPDKYRDNVGRIPTYKIQVFDLVTPGEQCHVAGEGGDEFTVVRVETKGNLWRVLLDSGWWEPAHKVSSIQYLLGTGL